jgi:two-component system CheB/CheR fusion protein
MAFVIVTHLAPDRESFLAEILARHSDLPLQVASDDQKVEANRIYVLPPNASLTIAEGRLRLSETERGHHERAAIDGVVATFVDVTSLAKSEERQRSLVSELNHRVKNMLSVVVSIAQQTVAHTPTPEEFQKSFFGRLRALARSHELLSRENWGEVAIERVMKQALTPFARPDSQRIALAGPAIMLSPALALSFGMIIDELATNAVKYGSLSNDKGRVAIDWSISGATGDRAPLLTLAWRESGGPPITPPEKWGFGMKLIRGEVEYSHSGAAQFDFAESGFTANFEIPLSRAQKEQP